MGIVLCGQMRSVIFISSLYFSDVVMMSFLKGTQLPVPSPTLFIILTVAYIDIVIEGILFTSLVRWYKRQRRSRQQSQ